MSDLTAPTSAVYDGAADQAAPVAETRATYELDGQLIYEDTGEFAGFVTGGSFLPDELKDGIDLEKYLERLMHEEAMLVAEQVKLDAVVANAKAAVKRQQSRVNWLRLRFDAQACALALSLLPRKRDGSLKTKTWDCPYGKVNFTTKQAALEVTDPDKAVEYAQQNGFDACVKVTTSFLISELPKDAYREMATDDKVAEGYGFKVIPAQEVPKVSTGIKKPKGGEDDAG